MEDNSLTICHEQTANIAKRSAQAIVSRGLETPAVLFLELHRPLLSLFHTLALACEPIATPLFGANRIQSLNLMLSDPKAIELLLQEIETLSAEKTKSGTKVLETTS
jgi:hypothetical protein